MTKQAEIDQLKHLLIRAEGLIEDLEHLGWEKDKCYKARAEALLIDIHDAVPPAPHKTKKATETGAET